ncbi:MAG: hypothetical protein LUC88_10985 [Prevotella sp.]|nr:hypothetical protein [Prevotella sp.]
MVGVHIRGTDNVKSKLHSPFNVFVNFINKELIKDPNTKFYLATDEIEFKKKLIDMFDDIIITNREVLNRNSLEGMEGALIDLYCLSKTDYIIGSYYSSFSEIAAEIGGIKLYKAIEEGHDLESVKL